MIYFHFFIRLWFAIMVPEETILEKMSTKWAHLDQNVHMDQQKHPRDCASMVRSIFPEIFDECIWLNFETYLLQFACTYMKNSQNFNELLVQYFLLLCVVHCKVLS